MDPAEAKLKLRFRNEEDHAKLKPTRTDDVCLMPQSRITPTSVIVNEEFKQNVTEIFKE